MPNIIISTLPIRSNNQYCDSYHISCTCSWAGIEARIHACTAMPLPCMRQVLYIYSGIVACMDSRIQLIDIRTAYPFASILRPFSHPLFDTAWNDFWAHTGRMMAPMHAHQLQLLFVEIILVMKYAWHSLLTCEEVIYPLTIELCTEVWHSIIMVRIP